MPNSSNALNNTKYYIITSGCNCRNPDDCPLQNNCQTSSPVYLSTISSLENPNIKKNYIGGTKNPFKYHWYQHVFSFKNSSCKHATSLSKYCWSLKEKNKTPTVKWNLIRRAHTCNSLYTPCYLFLNEKLEIIKFKKINLLNQRKGLTVNCRHKLSFNKL